MKFFDQDKLSIAEACDGQEAVDLFREGAGGFDLILMDCLMPIVDGFNSTVMIHEACREMGLEAVPVVAVTASVSADIQSKCYSSGMSYIVTKPFTERDLIVSMKSMQHHGAHGKRDATAGPRSARARAISLPDQPGQVWKLDEKPRMVL